MAPRATVAGVLAVLLVAPGVVGAHEPAAGGPRNVRPPDVRAPALAPGLSANPSLAIIREAPDFTLLDTAGAPVRLSALRGRAVLVSFIYTACPTACPLLTRRMGALAQRFNASGLLGTRVALLSVTVDPERDGAPVLARYAQGFAATPPGWRFLREEPARLAPALAAYDEWTRTHPNGEIDHPARLHLIDPRGRVREIYSLAMFDERQAFLDIQAVLRD